MRVFLFEPAVKNRPFIWFEPWQWWCLEFFVGFLFYLFSYFELSVRVWWLFGVFWCVCSWSCGSFSHRFLVGFFLPCSSWTRSLGIHPGRTFWREDLCSVEASKWDKWHHYTLWGEENRLLSRNTCHRAFSFVFKPILSSEISAGAKRSLIKIEKLLQDSLLLSLKVFQFKREKICCKMRAIHSPCLGCSIPALISSAVSPWSVFFSFSFE